MTVTGWCDCVKTGFNRLELVLIKGPHVKEVYTERTLVGTYVCKCCMTQTVAKGGPCSYST